MRRKDRFVRARDASMIVIKGGLSVEGRSDARSILVLPVQYSHCWVANDPNITLFRANLMQLGVSFSGELATKIRYEFGPFWHSSCRGDDGREAKRLNVFAARNFQIRQRL